jgi:outer membrane protein OmpA-like peptidoglycan-associated protein/tetratricopeptide (TPR) repeat protein
MKTLVTTLLLLILTASTSIAQYSTSNKKAATLMDQALSKYAAEMYSNASELADKALHLDPKFVEAYWLKADIAAKLNNADQEIQYLSKALELRPDDPTTIAATAEAYMKKYDNKTALEYYKRLFQLDRLPEKLRQQALLNKQIAEFRIHAIENPVDFNPENLGPNVNTKYNDYFPSLSADGKTLVYTIELPQTDNNPLLPDYQEDIFITHRNDDQPWQQAASVGATINSNNNEGAPFLSADGKILLLTSCTCPDGLIKCCDIYYSYLRNGEFTTPHPLPYPVNTNAWESQPSLSADNSLLFFVSNRKGGYGGKDIWYSTLIDNGKWSEPINCGPNVNTDKDESSPFIHADKKTLYFSSDGHPGMGGHDLFVSHLDTNGIWGTPINLGYPINTKDNEMRLAVSVLGNTAIISSDRATETKLDLFEITLPEPVRPSRTLLVQGLVKDAKSGDPIQSASYSLVNLSNGQPIQNGITSGDHINLMLLLPENNDYALNVKATGYLMNSMNFSLRDIPDSISTKYIEIALHKPDIGNTVTLENIFFDTDKYNIKPQSYYELNKFVTFLTDNPTLYVEIGGHTDNSGSESHNKELSQHRAEAIVSYLVSKGISSSRLTAKGYGSTKPCAPNDTKENMAKNRRTEFKIVNNK